MAEKLKNVSIEIYKQGAKFALEKGIIFADTKLEFGTLNGELILIDEALTPDSSRFWPKDQYEVGRDQPSFDKQIVRNYVSEQGWNKQPPAPKLPDAVVTQTAQAYRDAYTRLSGQELS